MSILIGLQGDTMLIKSLCGQQLHITQDTTFEFISMTNHFASIWWFVGWTLIFYPIVLLLLIIGLTRKAYVCKVNGLVVTISKDQYTSIINLKQG